MFIEFMPGLSEHQECVLFVNWLKSRGHKYTKTTQETFTSSRTQKRKNKIEGLMPGFPDYVIVVKKKGGEKINVFIEMKKKVGGVLRKEQKERLEWLEEGGAKVRCCKGAEEAILFVIAVENGEE